MTESSSHLAPLSLSPAAPLQQDAAYAPFLIHHTAPASCTCILCSRSSFDTLHSHLDYHAARTRIRLARRLHSSESTLPYIPHACLSIDASWSDWMRAVMCSAWETIRGRGEESEWRDRLRYEAAIQQLVNDRREDEQLQPHHSRPFSPFSPFAPPVSSHLGSPALAALPQLSSLPPDEADESDRFPPFADSSSLTEPPCFVIPTLSVRSSLCLYLKYRAFPPGSSVLLTAITIPDMLTVLQFFNLTPIPIDIDTLTLSPSVSSLRQHAQSGTVALLIAHLYGRQMALDALISEAQSLGLEVWEDMAEGFRGYTPNASASLETDSPYFAPFPLGSPQSDLVLFSFGAIKQLTAFGGGLLILPYRHQRTAEALLHIHHALPRATAAAYWQKCLKVLLGMGVLNVPLLSGSVMTSARVAGVDHKSLVVSLLRGFPSRLMHNLQHQPSLPLLQQLHYRLANASHSHLHTTVRGELFASLLPPSLVLPGFHSPSRHYWLFPLLPPPHVTTDRFLSELNRLGVDAYRGATQLAVVRGGGCVEAEGLMDRVVYLPVHASVPLRLLVRMAAIVQLVVDNEAADATSQPLTSAL